MNLQKLYTGKTKDVYLCDDGNVLLHFKDSVTGVGDRIDSGANEVIGRWPEKDAPRSSLRCSSSTSCIRREYLRTSSAQAPKRTRCLPSGPSL
jgi:hypothetical protein